jgi:cystathionine beta-lyase
MEQRYNFSKLINRENTLSIKWDMREQIFGREDIIPLWVADSDWQTAPEIKEEIINTAEHGIYGYSCADDEIKDSVQKWLKKRFDLNIKKDWIIFDSGVVPAINFTLKSLCNPGDGVIIQPPVYRPFFTAVKNNDCTLVENELVLEANRYKIDFEGLKNIINEWKTKEEELKAFIFCSPHNPVGRVWEKEELRKLIDILMEEDIYLLSDEIHADLVYPGFSHFPSLKLLLAEPKYKDYRKKVISYMAASKTFNIAGLHTSYTIIESESLRRKYERTKKGFATGNSPFGLRALKAAYDKGEAWLEAQLLYLEKNKEFLKEFFAENAAEIKVVEQEGTYLCWLDCRSLPFENDKELKNFFINQARVGLNPGSWFGKAGSGFMRLNIACPRERLEKGLKRIKKAVDAL